MIDNQLISIAVVFLESIGILLAEKRTALILGMVTIMTIVIFFMIK